MAVQPTEVPVDQLKVQCVNIHNKNERIYALLQKSPNIDILLIQEPWYGTIAILRSDNTPEGIKSKGVPINGYWDAHVPHVPESDSCQVLVYTKKRLASVVTNNL
jgi:hypothetical protein